MNENASDASFLDIATNTLAIVMIVTMFALLTAKPETSVLRDTRFEEKPELSLRVQPQPMERPFLDYYLVCDGWIVRWEQEHYVDALIAGGLRETVELPGGKLRVSTTMEPRDPDSFSATFVPDLTVLATAATPLAPETVEGVTAKIVGRMKSHGLAPNFVVFPSGMDAFEGLYRRLREEPIWLRWFLWPDDKPLRIERRVAHFGRFEFDF